MAALERTPSRHFGSSAGESISCHIATLAGETAAEVKERGITVIDFTVRSAAISRVCQVDHCHRAKAACPVPHSSNGRHGCRHMSRSASQHRHMSTVLHLLSQMADLFLPDSPAAQQGAGHTLDIREDTDFWALIQIAMVRPPLKYRLLRACYSGKEASAKKRLLHYCSTPRWQARASGRRRSDNLICDISLRADALEQRSGDCWLLYPAAQSALQGPAACRHDVVSW